MEYMTRHLVAKREMTHEGLRVQPGDTFIASPVDADYLVRRGHAIEGAPPEPVAPVVEAPAEEQVEIAPRRRGRPPKTAEAAVDAPAEPPAAPVDPAPVEADPAPVESDPAGDD